MGPNVLHYNATFRLLFTNISQQQLLGAVLLDTSGFSLVEKFAPCVKLPNDKTATQGTSKILTFADRPQCRAQC